VFGDRGVVMFKYRTSRCPKCGAVLVLITESRRMSEGGSVWRNGWPVNHPTCGCDVEYADFVKLSEVAVGCLVVFGEVEV